MKRGIKKILISGPSGSGKTTLARTISDRYDIPFISTSTKPLWDKYGFESHKDIISTTIIEPLKALEFQFELIEYRNNLLSNQPSFVSDRGYLDNMVYFLLQNSPHVNGEITNEYIRELSKAQNKLIAYSQDKLLQILLPVTNKMVLDNFLEDDGKRIGNPYYQLMCTSVFNDCLEQNYLKLMNKNVTILELKKMDYNYRLRQVHKYLRNDKKWEKKLGL